MENGTIDPRQLQRPQQNGSASGSGLQTNGLAPAASSQAGRLRIPTVQEALPYTPMSSVVPFNPDIIPPPLALPNTAPTAFHNDEGVQTARRDLERLAAGARSAEQAGNRCQKTLEDLKGLLNPDDITQYRFKTTKRIMKTTSSDKPLPQPVLSNMGKMLHDDTKIDFRLLTPPPSEEPKSPRKSGSPSTVRSESQRDVAQPQSPTTQRKPRMILGSPPPRPSQSTPAVNQHVQRAPSSVVQQPQRSSSQQNNAQLMPTPQRPTSVQQGTPLVQQNRTSQQQKTGPVPLVPYIPRSSQTSQHQPSASQQDELSMPITKHATPQHVKAYVPIQKMTPAQRAEYQRVPDQTPASTVARNQSAYLTNGSRANADQRYKADQALEILQNQLETIFAAEDQMQPDTSEDVSMRESALFSIRDTEEGSALILQADAQSRLDLAFKKVVSLNRLVFVEVDTLARVQRICERSLAALHSGSLEIGDDWSEDDTADWLGRVSNAETGLIAARTLMRIMVGGAHRKELQSEDCLKNVLDALRTVVEVCIIPVVQERASLYDDAKSKKDAPTNPKFSIAAKCRAELQALVAAAIKLLRQLGDLFAKTDVDESGVSSLQYMCKTLIFTENATNERDSVLGIQHYEQMRKFAMDVTSKIFTKYTEQRTFIIDEILMSLERLPANKQSARQYRPADAKPIQLVSALFMRLVQTSATPSEKTLRQKTEAADSGDELGEESEVADSESEAESEDSESIAVRKTKSKVKKTAADLSSFFKPLQQSTVGHASYIVKSLIQRASQTTKTSEEPYRKLLDIFVDDFINVLGHSDWPAAEVLLLALVAQLVQIVETPKSPAPSRTLALELLGVIGSGISELISSVHKMASATDADDRVSEHLVKLADDFARGEMSLAQLTSFDGPFRIVVQYLQSRNVGDDAQLLTARGYHLVQWADQVYNAEDTTTNVSRELQDKILHTMKDINWLDDHHPFPKLATAHGKLAARIVTANSKLCKAFDRIFNIILAAMRSEQPTVRSRSLKSVTTLLDQDPTVLDRNDSILKQIVHCMGDSSSLVRDSALMLLQKCVQLRPRLELRIYEKVVERTTDTSSSVRKRAMAFLKQVYLHIKDDNKVRAKISNAMISRIHDVDESVAEAARATIEDIWFSSFRGRRSEGQQSVEMSLQMRSHAALIIQTVALGDNVANVLEALIKSLLTKSKQAVDNAKICRSLVAVLFEGSIENNEIPGVLTQGDILQTLTVFARAGPTLFTTAQLELLEPYTKNLTTTDDLETWHFVVTILRYTLPVLMDFKPDFLRELQNNLLKSVTAIPPEELSVVAPCLWTIDGLMGNTERLVKFLISVMVQVTARQGLDLRDEKNQAHVKNLNKLLPMIGQFGKACHLDALLADFKANPKLNKYKGNSVAEMMVELCCKFTNPSQPMSVRETALEATLAICQRYATNYMREDVVQAIQLVFDGKEQSLEQVLLTGLEALFKSGEKGEDDPDAPELGSGIATGSQRLGGTYQATGFDTASSSLTSRFLKKHFVRIALGSTNDTAVTQPVRIIVSINTQGFGAPGDTATTLVALQTSSNTTIAKMAYTSYKEAWLKHESTLEKTLLKSVQEAFQYQKTVMRNTSGYTGHPPTSKLHYFWEILRTGSVKSRRKFFTHLCAAMDFDPAKMTAIPELSQHLEFVRFSAEAIAFLDYEKTDDVLLILSSLEKVFSGTGNIIAQAIENDVFRLQVPVSSQTMPNGTSDGVPAAPVATGSAPISAARLQQLAIAGQILSLVQDTRSYIQRLWQCKKYANKPKLATKDAGSKPSKATNAPAVTDAFQNRITSIMDGAADPLSQHAMCSSFVELMSVDSEVKVREDDDEDADVADDDDAHSEGSTPGPRGKKRKSMDGSHAKGPAKKRGRPRKGSVAKVTFEDDDDEAGWE